MTTYSASKQDRVMTEEQFTQVVEAILEGKYSWACLLILKFSGYNPLHYIPYRTYNRLMKDNKKAHPIPGRVKDNVNARSNQFQDLGYIESVEQPNSTLRGGDRPSFPDLTYWSLEHICRYF